jgi:hypothetical protein
MGVSLAIFVTLLLLSAGLVAAAWLLTFRLTPEANRSQMVRWLSLWSAKALLLPLGIWVLMNIGVSWSLQPFMPQIQAAQNKGGSWMPEFLRVTAVGLFILSSYWAAATLGWVVADKARGLDEERRKDFKALCWTCLLGLGIPFLIVFAFGGLALLGFATAIILVPLAGYAPGLLQPKKLPPMYARAIARVKFGKYSEAEWEIIRELEKREDDFEGWMMLAELYANHFNDLGEAERTVLEICDQPKLTPSQLSIALQRLADWYLKLAQDPDAARRALQMICDRLKGTHLAHMAQLRMNQLPSTRQELRDQHSAKPIPLPALGERLDQPPPPPTIDRNQAAASANGLVARLNQDPNNVSAREQLARVFTEQLQRVDLGIEQATLLLNMPGQPNEKRAEWLALVAAWEIKYRQDLQAGRRLLTRLVEEFPGTPQALMARRRLHLLDAEARRKSPVS